MDQLVDQLLAPRKIEDSTLFELRSRLSAGYIGQSPNSHPAMVVPISAGNLPSGRAVGAVRLSFVRDLAFAVDGKEWVQNAATLECLDNNVIRTFAALVSDIAAGLFADPSAKDVVDGIRSWERLLRSRSALTLPEQLGLWAEISVVLDAASTDVAVEAWQGPAGGTMDFIRNGLGLECKASLRERRHHVSAAQTNFNDTNLDCYLISIAIAEDAGAGRSLRAMAQELLEASGDESLTRKRLISAGYHEQQASEYSTKFVRLKKPAVFPMSAVPRIESWDIGISNVRYDIDLSHLEAVDDAVYDRLLQRLTGDKDDQW